MFYFVPLLCVLLHCVDAQKPFEVCDVTTLVRLNESGVHRISPSSNLKRSWTPDFPNSVYEVHSRTDAIGLQTNFKEITGFGDPLQESELTCSDTSNISLCKDWLFQGFTQYRWTGMDPILDWRPVQHGFFDKRYMKNSNTLETSLKGIYGYTMNSTYLQEKAGTRTERFDEIKVRFRLHKSIFFACPCRGTFDVYQGVEISLSSDHQGSRVLRGQDTEYKRNAPKAKAIGDREEVSVPDYVDTAYLTRNSLLKPDWLRLAINAYSNSYSERKIFDLSKLSNSFRVVPYYHDLPDFGVYKTNFPMAQRLMGRKGTVLSPVISDRRNRLCVVMRFFVNGTVNMKFSLFSLRSNGTEGPSVEMDFKGNGLLYNRKFSLTFGRELQHSSPTKLQISFETEYANALLIRSFRKCSGDADILFALPNQLKTRIRESSDKGINAVSDDPKKLPTTNVGFGIKSHIKAFPSRNPITKCYHGGINVEEWCQCLPGYTGRTCEEVCAPHQFGADCGGVCNPIGSLDCKGILLAGPGLPLECGRGYTGQKCDTECSPFYYGPNCKLQCGQCATGTCDRFSGRCNGPCRPGYTKDTCQDRLASLDGPPVLTKIGVDYVEGYVRFNESLDLYPTLKLHFKKEKESLWKSKYVSMNPGRNFTINKLDFGDKYLLRAAPVHKDGDFYQDPHEKVVEFHTKCNDFRYALKADLNARTLLVEWRLEQTNHPCKTIGYDLEISSPELPEPFVIAVGSNETQKSIEPVFLKEGSVRLKSIGETRQTSWSDPVSFEQHLSAGDADALKIKFVTPTRIDFQWTDLKNTAEDTLNCKSSVILCDGNENSTLTKRVKPGSFSIEGLSPFTRYTCVLETSGLSATTATKPDVPSVAPKNRLGIPVTSITDSKAVLQWEDLTNCTDLNGVFEGFVVELWNGIVHKSTVEKHRDTQFSVQFSNLASDTLYVIRVFLVNSVGWNKQIYAAIPFETKSKAPDAVTKLLAYKRTRNNLWLRWMHPESDQDIVKYKVILSASGVETKSDEFPPKQCDLWPDFVCYKVGGLVPDVEYNVTIEAQNGRVNHYGSPATILAVTKETEPEAPENAHVENYTPHSIMLGWQVPVILNSDPKFFVITLDQVDAHNSNETMTVSTQITVHLSENVESYQLKVDDLNPASSYVMTISAGNRGARAVVHANTPPEKPPGPRAPVISKNGTKDGVRIIARGIEAGGNSSALLSVYLVLVSTNSSKDGVYERNLAESLKTQFGSDFTVVEELPSDLVEEVVILSGGPSRRGKLSSIDKTPLESGQNYRVAVAAISSYRGAHSATISPVITYQ